MRNRLQPDDLIADDFDEAIIGVAEIFTPTGSVRRVLYDIDICIEMLAKDLGYAGAEEHFEYNVLGAYVGENTPMFVNNRWRGVNHG
jgi:hypothetical protein